MKQLILLISALTIVFASYAQTATDKTFNDRFEQDTGETLYRLFYPKGISVNAPITLVITVEEDNPSGYLMFEVDPPNPLLNISSTNYPTSVPATKSRHPAGSKYILTTKTAAYVDGSGNPFTVVYLRVEGSADNHFFTVTHF